MFSCNRVIHSRKSWSAKLAGWLPRACRRRMQRHAWRALSLHCSLVVLPTHRGCQAKDFLGAMRALVWSVTVCEGKYSWQHWHCPGEASPGARGHPAVGFHCASRYTQGYQWSPLLFVYFHVDRNPRKKWKGEVLPWGQQKSYYVLDTFWSFLKPYTSCPCHCWKSNPRKLGLKYIGRRHCQWRQAPELFPLVEKK